jgi:hypothetical protein
MVEIAAPSSIAEHGASQLPSVLVDSYNIKLRDEEGFIGDRASKGSFRDLVEQWRKPLRKAGKDPFGDNDSEHISKKEFDALLTQGDPEAAGVIHGAIEDFSQELARVIRRYLKTKAWKNTAHRDRRRLPREPHWRTRDRSHSRNPDGRQTCSRSGPGPE